MRSLRELHGFKSLAAGLFLGLAAIVVSAAPAHAVIMSGDDPVFGVDSITIDTVNMNDWLDLTESTSRSFNDVAGQFGAGGDFEGWRHATSADLTTFFTEAGFPPPTNVNSSSPAMVTFIGLVGITFSTNDSFAGDNRLAEGWYDDGDVTMIGFGSLRNRTGGTNIGPAHSAILTPDFGSPNSGSSQAGNWLVRSSIPEPSALALVATGLAGLGIARRRRSIRVVG